MPKSELLFGTVGAPLSTPKNPGGTVGGIRRLKELGLGTLELAWVQSVRVSEGKCAEMCGTYHSQMLFWVEVVDQATFDAKMQELREAGQTGQLETGRPDTGANDLGKTRIGDDS